MASKKEQDENRRLGVQARLAALKTFQDNHRDEFEELVVQERLKRGLPPQAGGYTIAEQEERIRRQEERLKRWKDELRRALGDEPLAE